MKSMGARGGAGGGGGEALCSGGASLRSGEAMLDNGGAEADVISAEEGRWTIAQHFGDGAMLLDEPRTATARHLPATGVGGTSEQTAMMGEDEALLVAMALRNCGEE